uniref:Uncharacterized protein n=1 Tax=Anguilla anguilla TaxID=7936 RepID=A0A0E9SST9_ANGAN
MQPSLLFSYFKSCAFPYFKYMAIAIYLLELFRILPLRSQGQDCSERTFS